MASRRQRARPAAAKVHSARRERGSLAQRLKPYHDKRHFERTPEPSGGTGPKRPPSARGQELQFVVQKHAARSLHYDFRLELAGVLHSWSVPKGPSLRPGVRRLAVRTEDHPLDYANFEGVIPKGEYGGGTVIVWDRGTWTPQGDPQAAVQAGRLTFSLHGEKLQGRFHLVRTRLDEGKRENWLLFKGHDSAAGATDAEIVEQRPESAISGRTIDEVAELPARVWHSNRAQSGATPHASSERKTKPASQRKRKVGSADRADPATAVQAKRERRTEPSANGAPQDTVALVKRLPMPFKLTNLDKVLYPEQQLRKADLIAYYVAVASYMLPYVKDRPLTLLRCPHGSSDKCFYQKHIHTGVPDAVLRVPIEEAGEKQLSTYMAVQDLPGLIALVQMGVLEIHTWRCHRNAVERPDQLVFDIDPDPALAWQRSIEAALELRERLSDVGLQSFVQTTGGKGLHVLAPVHGMLDWEQHKAFAHAIAESMASDHPKRYLTNMRKALRKGRIFLDYLRNGRGATAIAPYSSRARDAATVAAPITWDELAQGAQPGDFTIRSMVDRVSELEADPWRNYGREQSIAAEALRDLRGNQ